MEEIEAAKKRCTTVIHRITNLPERTNITSSCKGTLLKLAQSELSFLSRCHRNNFPLSTNIGHLEAVVHLLHHPLVTGVSRVCKPVPLSENVHVDIICTFNKNPAWIVVSDRNPDYVFWVYDQSGRKGLKLRLEQILGAAARCSQAMRPCSVILFFSRGIGGFVSEKMREEFGAREIGLEFGFFDFDCFGEEGLGGEWVNLVARPYGKACVLEIEVDCVRNLRSTGLDPAVMERRGDVNDENLDDIDGFGRVISGLKLCSSMKDKAAGFSDSDDGDFINFDTTALIALVSGISNGCAEKLLATPQVDLIQRFKGNVEFVIGQVVMSEIQSPILGELDSILSGKKGIICESVLSEFKELVSLCGGPNENLRAHRILRRLMVVPDNPSERMMGLPTTRKLALKNKVVFGTGDHWHAPTLTANMAFVRAVSQTGMPLFTIQHRPRALTGD
ncbi:hypothetical protein Tsubulata_016433 [Turnera subulata]|uniref:DUF1308 domain-containing protein n=1 Tax=Turnera subulata TaxID=218843 RepID=A0A9Q0J0V7_9ROSI|nr:hypothetical protein Tsubulata_016433 [Turnera subulata]